MNNTNLAMEIKDDPRKLKLQIDALLAKFSIIHHRVEELFANPAFLTDVGNEIALAIAPKDVAETDKNDKDQKDGTFTDNK